ncbi:MAG: hypothetical protein LBU83_07210 [Bacteroidales bacterium]|jgi:hypothetical protein|nr:hypothetical protein [Bacteroidales bacterium]
MSNELWYDCFIQALYEKYPRRSHLILALKDLLFIEREAVYRRLRKDVLFSINEIVKIASEWHISLDKITSVNSGKIPFLMQPMNYIDPSKEELKFLRQIIDALHYFKDFSETEFMDICNKLPRQLHAGYKYLNLFYLFKWNYQYGDKKKTVPFSQTTISEEKTLLDASYYQAIKQVPNSNFIWDRMIFDYLVSDILYFQSIQVITDEDKKLIKNDLYALLDYIQEVADKGCYPETQNKVNLYISQLSIDANYSYTFTPEVNICFVHAFEKFEIYTFEKEMVENFRNWMQLKKRTSVQISEVDERSRIEFFSKQRQLVDQL